MCSNSLNNNIPQSSSSSLSSLSSSSLSSLTKAKFDAFVHRMCACTDGQQKMDDDEQVSTKFRDFGIQCDLDKEEEELEKEAARIKEEEEEKSKEECDRKNDDIDFAVVEFHFFKSDDNFIIIKEVAIIDYKLRHVVLHFKSPFPKTLLSRKMYRDVSWLEHNYHKIRWDQGDLIYTDALLASYLQNYTTIYTKGREKTQFLKRLHDNVLTMPEDIQKPDYTMFENSWCFSVCKIHNKSSNGRCALFSAYHYLTILMCNKQTKENSAAASMPTKNMSSLNRNAADIDYTCENNRMESMKHCKLLTKQRKRNYARQGFYFDGESIVCVYCGFDLISHKARVCSLTCSGGREKRKAINFTVLVPLI